MDDGDADDDDDDDGDDDDSPEQLISSGNSNVVVIGKVRAFISGDELAMMAISVLILR